MIENQKTPFKPSMNVLSRMARDMLESGPIGKTLLSRKTRVNYPRVVEHLNWMKRKRLVETVVQEDKIKFRLTEKGIEFAKTLSDEDFY